MPPFPFQRRGGLPAASLVHRTSAGTMALNNASGKQTSARRGVHNRAAVVVIGVLLPTEAVAVAIWLHQQHPGGGTYGK